MKIDSYINVILIDDENYILKALSEIIPWNELGFQICGTFTSGHEALQHIEKHKVDVVITDILMPNMTGIELTKKISTDYPHIQTLILSSSNEFNHVKEALISGAKDYMLKPNINVSSMKEFLERNIPHSIPLQSLNEQEQLPEEKGFANIQQTTFKYPYFYGIFLMEQPSFPLMFFANQIKNTGMEHVETTIYSQDDHHLLLINTAKKISLDTFTHDQSHPILFPFTENTVSILTGIHILTKLDTPLSFYISANRLIWDYQWHAYTSESVTHNSLLLQEHIQNLQWEAFREQFTLLFTRHPIFLPKNELISIYINIALSFIQRDLKKQDQAITKITILKSISSKNQLQELNEEIMYIAAQQTTQPILGSFEKQILEYIQKNYHLKINLHDVASHFHFNYNYFSNQFNEMMGTSFNDYLNNVRIEKAKELLLKQDMPMLEVATHTGFSDIAYFSKVFKKVVGLTPSKYKRTVRQLEQN